MQQSPDQASGDVIRGLSGKRIRRYRERDERFGEGHTTLVSSCAQKKKKQFNPQNHFNFLL